MQPVWLLMGAIGVIGSNSLLLSPIARDVAASFEGRSAEEVMLASALYGGGTAVSALFLAPQADRVGLGRALIWSLCGLGLALCLSVLAPSVGMLCIAQAAAGLCAGVALPAIYGLAADVAPNGRESETLGKVLTGWTLSLVAGVSLSAVVSDLVDWRAVYAVLAIGAASLALAIGRAGLKNECAIDTVASPLAALRIDGLVPPLASVMGYMAAFYGLYAYLGAHLTETIGLSTSMAGLAALSYGIGFGAVAPIDRLIDRHGADRAGPVVFAGLLGVYGALALASASGVALIVLCLLWGAVNHLGVNILVGQLTALSRDRRGAILGLYSFATYAAMFAGTASFGPIYAASGFATIAIASAICVAPCLAIAVHRFFSLRKGRTT
jgi:DHA1 family inner membrane transport protein